ncbi:hypothetical protein [Pseudooceanicola onchidii]|uniref:hypothetical protein n=1 Tax=Pseudooceanicola onchidii TaxID=2562279 RepID=UPI0010A9A632|nr:hypothetical protein [Pseudooceanicola onchidii]
MKRIAALSLIAALAATGASANNTKPTVSSQGAFLGGLGGAGVATGAIIAGAIAVGVVVAATESSSGT